MSQSSVDGDIDHIEFIKKEIGKCESEIKGILEGNIVLKWKPRDMTKEDIADALTNPKIANNDSLCREIIFGMVKKSNPITGEKLLSIINSPLIAQYLKIIEEMYILNNEKIALEKKELEIKKLDFTQTYYKPIIDKILQMSHRAYKELEALSVKKEQMKSNYGMSEKAAMESLSYEERRDIENTESKIMQLDDIQNEMQRIYDKRVMTAKSRSGFEEEVRWLKMYVEKKKTEEWKYPVVKQLFAD